MREVLIIWQHRDMEALGIGVGGYLIDILF